MCENFLWRGIRHSSAPCTSLVDTNPRAAAHRFEFSIISLPQTLKSRIKPDASSTPVAQGRSWRRGLLPTFPGPLPPCTSGHARPLPPWTRGRSADHAAPPLREKEQQRQLHSQVAALLRLEHVDNTAASLDNAAFSRPAMTPHPQKKSTIYHNKALPVGTIFVHRLLLLQPGLGRTSDNVL